MCDENAFKKNYKPPYTFFVKVAIPPISLTGMAFS
jgi:hypothetical protein